MFYKLPSGRIPVRKWISAKARCLSNEGDACSNLVIDLSSNIFTFSAQQSYSFRMSSRRESDFVCLEQLLQEERRRAQEPERNQKEADESAELERRRAQDAESRAQIEEEKTKPTTLEEYLHACHTFLSKLLRIQKY
jgi:hypothetical protein